jgi:protein phosphatase
MAAVASGAGRREPDVLDLGDVLGSRVIETGYLPRVGVREGHAAAALEVISRFAVDPRWLLYLPPTMSPVATSPRHDLLEHPDQAFAAYRADGVDAVVCEEKHMGSRAVLLVCRSPDVAAERFGVPGPGAIWTRTGRPFFAAELTAALIGQLRAAAEQAGLFTELGTSWLLLDAELLPWNVKAGPLLRDQYAAVGAAARAALPAAVAVLEQASARNLPGDGDAAQLTALLDRTRNRSAHAAAFTAAYLRYCWETQDLSGVRVAPFQLLASEGAVYQTHPHLWHLDVADRLAAARPELIATTRRLAARTSDPASTAAATQWWEELTVAGGEGMVVKPAANLTHPSIPAQPGTSAHPGLVQPGLKVRGREYLRIIYGPDYTNPAHLTRLRQRAVGHKRSLALREYALGLEALDRVARGEPLWRVHECVFAVLALESEPIDPRLLTRPADTYRRIVRVRSRDHWRWAGGETTGLGAFLETAERDGQHDKDQYQQYQPHQAAAGPGSRAPPPTWASRPLPVIFDSSGSGPHASKYSQAPGDMPGKENYLPGPG